MKKIIAILSLTVSCTLAVAQGFRISGTATDSLDNAPLAGATVLLQNVADTLLRQVTVSDKWGRFEFMKVDSGTYLVRCSYTGYDAYKRKVSVRSGNLDLGTLQMQASVTMLGGIEVYGEAVAMEQIGDTLQYNANAFKVHQDATMRDLLRKMPGIIVDKNAVNAQGERVQQILIDGKPFFGGDAAAALRSLPAEMIARIEVFDRLSEQAQLTGVDDGQTGKTINIVTKKAYRKGVFGKVHAGAGQKDRYLAGGNFNAFNSRRKISLVGTSNNINQHDLNAGDLPAVFGAAGISATNAVALNYEDRWGGDVEVTGNYSFNRSHQRSSASLQRAYLTSTDGALSYHETNDASNAGYYNGLNMRLEYSIDTFNTLIVMPGLTWNQNDSQSALNGTYSGDALNLQTETGNRLDNHNRAYGIYNSILYHHRFARRGRSLSWNIGSGLNSDRGNAALYSSSAYHGTGEATMTDQHSDNHTDNYTVSSNLAYTEPLGKNGLIQVNYELSFNQSVIGKRTHNLDVETGLHTRLDSLLSNTFENTYLAKQAGISYSLNNKKYTLMSGIRFQQSRLSGRKDFGDGFQVDRSFRNFLPQLTFNYKLSGSANLRVAYRTSAGPPSVTQLQPVVDNRNPLFLTTGNPDLKQNYNHTFSLQYNRTNIERSSSLFLYLHGQHTSNSIANSTFIAPRDTLVSGVHLGPGSQLTYPVNLDGYWNAQVFFTGARRIRSLQSNLSLNLGFNYNRVPAAINGVVNPVHNYNVSQGVVISSNISDRVDFTLSSTTNYWMVKSTLQGQSDNNYVTQVSFLSLDLRFWQDFVFNTTLNSTLFNGLPGELDQGIWFWNAGFGYKVLKSKALTVKLNAADILNQNKSISRSITDMYVQDQQTNVLTRYFMFTVTYNVRKF